MPVLTSVFVDACFVSHRDAMVLWGEFTGQAGANPTGVKFKGNATVVRNGAGLYTLTLTNRQGNAVKGLFLKSFSLTNLKPALTTDGGWNYAIVANNINSAGTIQFQTQNQSWAAADILVLTKVEIELSTEDAS